MKINPKITLSLLAVCVFALGARAASFTSGNIVVEQYGDGSVALSAASCPIFVLEYLPSTASQSSPVQSIAIPTTGGSQLVAGGSATSEGFITRSTNGGVITFPGYGAGSGITAIVSSNATVVPRCVGVMDPSGNFTRVAVGPTTMYSAANIRSTVSDGNSYWTSGSSGGVWYSAGGATPIQVGTESTSGGNLRVARIFNGTLYYSTASGTTGVFVSTNGLPSSFTNTALAQLTNSPSGTSPYDFAFSPGGNVAYVADDGTLASGGGIHKWTFNGTYWTHSFVFTTVNGLANGCRGLAVDFSGPHPVIYATDAATPSRLLTITDTSAFTDTSDAADQATILATAPANTAFRGVALAPVTAAPQIASQTLNTNILENASVTLTANAYGTSPLAYQWYYPNLSTPVVNGASGFGGTIAGATSANLTLTAVNLAQAGNYQVIITNSAGSVTSRVSQVAISAVAVAPNFTNQPVDLTVNAGDPATFAVVAGGTSPLSYQWQVDNGTTTNPVVGSIYSGTNTATLSIAAATVGLNGLKYFCTVTNVAGVTNSAKATLTVIAPQTLTIAQFRAKVDGSFAPTNTVTSYTMTGIVTTFSNMTSSTTSSEFFIQDSTAGIAVFWSGGAPSANLPPAGALVQVTGPMAAFDGLLEIEPVFGNSAQGVVVISTNNPLPAAQPLPMDPNVTFAQIKSEMEGSYFVVSNVSLTAGAAFGSGVNEFFTNNVTHPGLVAGVPPITFTNHAGDVFTIYIPSFGALAGQPKPSGPVTLYGVLNFNSLSTGSAGFELTPSRLAEVVSYVSFTNVLTNARPGSPATNNYVENVVRLGESIATYVRVSDPEGGSVTLTPTGTLPTGASWNTIVNGLTATAVFTYAGNAADAGNSFPIQLNVTSTAGTAFTETFNVYVPTPQEQQIAITELLVNPTSDPSSPFYNPLARASAVNGIGTNDEYVEIVNQSPSDLTSRFTLDTGNAAAPVYDSFAGIGTLLSSNSLIVYGGNGNPATAPGLSTPVDVSGPGLFLPYTGTGTLVLRNGAGNIIDRVVYSGSGAPTNGSLSRFPAWNSAFVPQAYVATKAVTPGAQYDNTPWSQPPQIPTGITSIQTVKNGTNIVLNFGVTASQAATLWNSAVVSGPYSVIYGRAFPGTAGAFTNAIVGPQQFYYITTQVTH